MQRPGTLDYSRWEALDTSSSDDEPPQRMPMPMPTPPPRVAAAPSPPPPAPPQQQAVTTAPPEVSEAVDMKELFVKVLPVLLAHPTALAAATLDAVDALPDLPVLAKLAPVLLAALRGVAEADTAPRAAARLACVCADARAAAAELHLNDATPPDRKALQAIDRRNVATALVHGLQWYDEDGNLQNVFGFVSSVVQVCNIIRDWPPAAASESAHVRFARRVLQKDLHKLAAVANVTAHLNSRLHGKPNAETVMADECPGAFGQLLLTGCLLVQTGMFDLYDVDFDADLQNAISAFGVPE
jgi:hypothetical protein